MMKNIFIIFSIFLITSCGGGGGGASGGSAPTPTTPVPTVNLSADPVSVLLNNTSTLTWSSTNATSCSASWTSQTSTSGSETVTITMAGNNSYSISCSGSGGSRSASVVVEGYRNTDGVVVDGYISGAEVCIDEDESWTCDSNESSTTSDNDGKITIKYANGNLVSIGGTDLDSQTLLDNLLITHKLTGHSDFKAITPVTSVAAFMTDAANVNAALGIDSTIDVAIFDPVANKGDVGIYDYLYEKGNQLTVLAYALQNVTNNLNTTTETTQDYFKAISEEIEKEYTETETKVDIETEAFITKALDNIIEAKTVTITDEAKANTAKALSGVMPVIEVKWSDDLTTSVIRFAVSTLQTDIQAIANGTAIAETVTSYTSDVLTYIAEDQNINANEITPNITAIADFVSTQEDTSVTINVVLNDSFLTSASISVSSDNGTNGSTTLAESSPEQIVYSPNADYNGTDIFAYTITQGDKTSTAEVTVNIEAVNDAPSIDIASTIQAAENQTAAATISVSDVDEDDLALTLNGTDADSFDLSTKNVLTFKEAPDFEGKNMYYISLLLTDNIEMISKDIVIEITNVNDVAPEITSTNSFTVVENQTYIATLTATDIEGDILNFSVSSLELEITPTGILTFKEVPNYEIKSYFTATVTVSDGVHLVTQDIIINIADEVEGHQRWEKVSYLQNNSIERIIGFDGPYGLVIHNDTIYVSDLFDHKVVTFSPDYIFEKWLGYNGLDKISWNEGIGFKGQYSFEIPPNGMLNGPHASAISSSNKIYIADYFEKRVYVFNNDGNFSHFLAVDDSVDLAFKGPANIHIDQNDTIYISDYSSNRVFIFDKEEKFIGWLGESEINNDNLKKSGRGIRSSKLGGFDQPHMVATDKSGNIYVVEESNNRIQKFSSSFKPLGWIGFNNNNISSGWRLDNPPIASNKVLGFDQPVSITVVNNTHLVIADHANFRVLKYNLDGNFEGWIGGTDDNPILNWRTDDSNVDVEYKNAFFRALYDAKFYNNKLLIADGHKQHIVIIDF